MKKCNACGEANKDNAKFCIKCGKQLSNLTPLCPNCKSIIAPDDIFCNKCGKELIETGSKKESYKYIERPVAGKSRNRNFKIFMGLIGGFAAIAIIALILVFVVDIGNLTNPFKSTTEAQKVEEDKTDEAKETTEEAPTGSEEEAVITDTSSGRYLIAFSSSRGSEASDSDIYVMDPDGSNKVNLTDNDSENEYPSWSPDGSKIAFYSDRDGGWDGTGFDYDIYVMDSDGSNLVQLTDNDSYDGFPSWSPDGSKIAFYSDRDGDSDIYVMDSDGSNLVQLTTDNGFTNVPHWSPDGSQIAYLSARSGTQQLHLMDLDGGNDRQLTSGSGLDVSHLVWLPDGNRIAIWVAGTGGWQWQAVDVATGEITPQDEWTFQADSFMSMSLSHDGTHLAYLVQTKPEQGNSPREIYIQDIDGSNTYALTSTSWIIQYPIWSPDDSQIAFLSSGEHATGKNAIYTINLDGSNLHELITTDLDPWMIAWSPDGESLAVDAGGVLYEVDIKTGERTALFKIEEPNSISHLSWSH